MSNKKSKAVTIILDDEEYEATEKLARYHNKSIFEYIRSILNRESTRLGVKEKK